MRQDGDQETQLPYRAGILSSACRSETGVEKVESVNLPRQTLSTLNNLALKRWALREDNLARFLRQLLRTRKPKGMLDGEAENKAGRNYARGEIRRC